MYPPTGVLTCESIPQFDEEEVDELFSTLQYENDGKTTIFSLRQQLLVSTTNN